VLNLGVDITLTSQAKAAESSATSATWLTGVTPGHAVNSSLRRIAFAMEPADRRGQTYDIGHYGTATHLAPVPECMRRVCPAAIVALPRFRG
jgi:hypothetical protein